MTVRPKFRQSSGGAGGHPAIAAMVEQIRRVPSVERILLFGSRARGDHDERSDIDLAVACPGADDADWARIWLIVDDAPTLLAVDLVRLEHAGHALRQQIKPEGLVLYERR
jgi:predicted nucleotidyltransferase